MISESSTHLTCEQCGYAREVQLTLADTDEPVSITDYLTGLHLLGLVLLCEVCAEDQPPRIPAALPA